MSKSGLRIKDGSGRVLLDSDTYVFGLVGKGSAQAYYDEFAGGFAFIENLPPFQMVAVRCADVGLELSPQIVDGDSTSTQFAFAMAGTGGSRNVTVEYWLFKKYKLFPKSNVGLRLKNGAGEITFDAGYAPLRIVGKQPITGIAQNQSTFYGYEYGGRSVAYMAYGTVFRQGFAMPQPPPRQGDGAFAFQANAYRPFIRHGVNGFSVIDGFNPSSGQGWGVGVYSSGGSVYDGGVLLVDVTNY